MHTFFTICHFESLFRKGIIESYIYPDSLDPDGELILKPDPSFFEFIEKEI